MPGLRVFALADLHLSLSGAKPMDVFGEIWKDHPRRMAAAWDAVVGADDLVLLPGDLSWGRNLAEAAPDLTWIGERPGRKLLLRGNHDSWWSARARVRRALPPGCDLLQHDAREYEGLVILGARGWNHPDDPGAAPEDGAVYRREIERLRLSIEDADRRFGRAAPRLAMTHFPPCHRGRPDSEVLDLLVASGARIVVYGHLHGADHEIAITGLHRGIEFRLVAADAVGFAPVEIHTRWPQAC